MLNLQELASNIVEKKASGILIKKPANIFFVSNFSGSGYLYFSVSGEIILYTDARYSERAAKECFKNVKIIEIKEAFKNIASDISLRAGLSGFSSILFESDYITYDEYESFAKEFGNKLNFIPAGAFLSKIRTIKDKKELDYIMQAVSVSEKAVIDMLMKIVCSNESECISEKKASLIYKKNLLDFYSAESFETIVLSGRNSSIPHGLPSADKIISKSGVLLCDFGAEINGYKSDETFTVHLGKPDKKFLDVYDAVYTAQQKAISKIKPGVKFGSLDKTARDYIEKRGYGKYFTHSLGHGVGLDIHEYPYVGKKNLDTVKEGMVFTVEPGVYLEGEFGVRIEDMCYVEREGARIITGIKKNKHCVEGLL
jgi:Xaa-Pro aminopeptidase